MPQKPQSAPDFIPAEEPDFIPAEDSQPTPPADNRNALQHAFDDLTTVTPEQEKGHSWLTNKAQEFGAGAIQGFGSPFVHPVQTAQGLVHAFAHPVDTATSMGKSVWTNPAEAAGNLVGNLVLAGGAGEAAAGLPKAFEAIPTRAKAGRLFEHVMSKAENEPVWMQNSGDELVRSRELMQRGGGRSTPVTALDKRVGNVNQPPLTYREARDYAQNLGRLSAGETQKLSPVMGRQVGKLSHAFNDDVGDAAGRAGVGPEYRQAMNTYRNAMRTRNALINTGKWVVGPAIGVGIAGKLVKELIPSR